MWIIFTYIPIILAFYIRVSCEERNIKKKIVKKVVKITTHKMCWINNLYLWIRYGVNVGHVAIHSISFFHHTNTNQSMIVHYCLSFNAMVIWRNLWPGKSIRPATHVVHRTNGNCSKAMKILLIFFRFYFTRVTKQHTIKFLIWWCEVSICYVSSSTFNNIILRNSYITQYFPPINNSNRAKW